MRVNREAEDGSVNLSLFVNGAIASGNCGITVRRSELVDFIRQVNPDGVEVDREQVSGFLVAQLGPLESERSFIRYV